jgi:hypothetical protein
MAIFLFIIAIGLGYLTYIVFPENILNAPFAEMTLKDIGRLTLSIILGFLTFLFALDAWGKSE